MHTAIHGLGLVLLASAAACVVAGFVLDWRDGNRGWFWGDLGQRWMTAALLLMLAGAFLASR